MILFIDLFANFLIEEKWVDKLSWSFNSLSLFVIVMVCFNGVLGWVSLKENAEKWLLYSWIGLYTVNIVYFLFRWGLFKIHLMPNSFLFNGSANIGLSVFTFSTFKVMNYAFNKSLNKKGSMKR